MERGKDMAFRPLELGSADENVRLLQESLITLGYNIPELTGVYDRFTQRAVKAFQNDYGLRVSGTVNEETWDMLLELVSGQSNFNDDMPGELEEDIAHDKGQLTDWDILMGYRGSNESTPSDTAAESMDIGVPFISQPLSIPLPLIPRIIENETDIVQNDHHENRTDPESVEVDSGNTIEEENIKDEIMGTDILQDSVTNRDDQTINENPLASSANSHQMANDMQNISQLHISNVDNTMGSNKIEPEMQFNNEQNSAEVVSDQTNEDNMPVTKHLDKHDLMRQSSVIKKIASPAHDLKTAIIDPAAPWENTGSVTQMTTRRYFNKTIISAEETLPAIVGDMDEMKKATYKDNDLINAEEKPRWAGELKPIQWGSRNRTVNLLQRRLTELGYFTGPINGYFGIETRNAVIDFQLDRDIRANGIVDNETWRALYQVMPENKKWNTIKRGQHGQDVATLQRYLYDLGYYKEKPNGSFDNKTHKAAVKFQQDNKLKDNGIIDDEAWEAMENTLRNLPAIPAN